MFIFGLFNNILLISVIIITYINIISFLIKYRKLTAFIIIIFNKNLNSV